MRFHPMVSIGVLITRRRFPDRTGQYHQTCAVDRTKDDEQGYHGGYQTVPHRILPSKC